MSKYIKSLKRTITDTVNISTTLTAFSKKMSKYHIIVSRPFKTTMMHLNLKYYPKPSQDSNSNLKLTPMTINKIKPFLPKSISKKLGKHKGQYIRLDTKGLVYYDTKYQRLTNASKLGHKYMEKAILKQIKYNYKFRH